MKRILIISSIFAIFFSDALVAQSINLSAVYDASKSVIRLNWNMIANPLRTGYLLLKSTNGIEWTEAAKDRMLRNYTQDDIYNYADRNVQGGKIYYRLKIFDVNNNTIALSPIVTVNNGDNPTVKTVKNQPTESIGSGRKVPQTQINNNNWVLYPNPAIDYLTLNYKGSTELKGVVNVQVQDATGKTVVKFRSGSAYKSIQVPISNLQRGIYYVQVTVQNEVMTNQRFVKQ